MHEFVYKFEHIDSGIKDLKCVVVVVGVYRK